MGKGWKMKRKLDPRLAAVLSMGVFGTLGPFVRNIPVSSGELALYRAVLAALMIGGFLLVTKQRIPFRKIGRGVPLLLLSGAAMGFNWILLFEAYRYTTVSTATLCYYFAPVLVTIASPILFGEKLGGKGLLCFVMSTLGIVLITGVGNIGGGKAFLGILFALGAAVLYASVVLMNKFIRSVDGIHRTFLQFFAAALVLVPYVLANGGVTLGRMDGVGWICLLTVGLVHTGVAYCLYFTALKDLSGRQAAILSYVDPLVAVMVSVLVLGEGIGLMEILGAILILGFTLYSEITPKKEKMI